MAYSPTTWVDNETVVSAARMNNIEQGISAAYVKPDSGIPSTDMASAAQTSLGKADTAYQKPSGGIPGTDLADSYIEEPSSDGTSGQVLTTDGNGGRSWTTVQGGGGSDIDDTAGAGDTDKAWSADKLTTEFGAVPEKKTSTASGVDLDIADSNGKVLARFSSGHIATKNFDSSEVINDIETLQTAVESSFIVPSYWVSTLESKEATINSNGMSAGGHGVSFIFFTDYHQNTNNGKSVQLMRHVMAHTSVTDVFYGGDTTDGGSLANTAAAEAKLREMANLFKPLNMYPARGNHDCEPTWNSTSNQIPDAAYYDLFVRPIESKIHGTGKAYFYVDNDIQKVRYIITDSGSNLNTALDSTQITWIKSRLTELTQGWTVVIFQHMLYEGVGTASQTIISEGTTLLNAIDDVFSNLNCTIAAVISGHTHADGIISTSHNFKVITTTCDSGGANASSYDPVNPTRTAGTTSEQAFDVFTIDTTAKTISITRIGAGSDRSTSY